MEPDFHRYETMTLAELDKHHDELLKKFAVLRQRIDALKTAQRKPKRAKK